ncbi:transcriptional regulator, TetR family [Stigmatella aurantiaca]|uniref:Transcriptional regulator, TetR family n=2 Tax=Stigmatella aurantiaca TaxID=41 RepID=A0A1H7Z5M6_STIAU|nr:transcriptional regulator, TetR family [Stigmatella aurantiaca]
MCPKPRSPPPTAMPAPPTPPRRPGPQGGPREKNRRERMKVLSEAALRLFLERGLDAVTIDDITQASEVAKGTFYRYFEDKTALVDALLEPVRRELLDGLEACGRALSEAREVEAMFEAYRAMAAVIASALLQYPGVVRLYLQECRGPSAGARIKVVELSRLVSRHAVSITEKAHTHGLLRPIRPAVSGLAVVGAVERLLLAVLSEEPIGNPLELPDALTTLVLDGLRLPPPVARRKMDGKPGRP